MASVGIDCDAENAKKVIESLKGKNIDEVVAEGQFLKYILWMSVILKGKISSRLEEARQRAVGRWRRRSRRSCCRRAGRRQGRGEKGVQERRKEGGKRGRRRHGLRSVRLRSLLFDLSLSLPKDRSKDNLIPTPINLRYSLYFYISFCHLLKIKWNSILFKICTLSHNSSDITK